MSVYVSLSLMHVGRLIAPLRAHAVLGSTLARSALEMATAVAVNARIETSCPSTKVRARDVQR
jgi:hypothetical protein